MNNTITEYFLRACQLRVDTNMKNIIYLDNNSTTAVDPRILESILPFYTNIYGNPNSNHIFGVDAKKAIDRARESISQLINCEPFELIFTSGATEAINLALKGLTGNDKYHKKHILTIQTEHKAILDSCSYLEKKGYDVTYLPVNSDGLIDLQLFNNSIRTDTLLVAAMMVNNETGVFHPISQLSSLAHEKEAFFMTDATQAFGKIPIDVNQMGIDILCFSGHKIHGPKGTGGVYIRQTGKNKLKLQPLLHGGGHENGLRSGTLNVPGIVSLGEISKIALIEMENEGHKIKLLRDYMETELLQLNGTSLNGDANKRIYNVSNISFEGADSDAIIMELTKSVADLPLIIVSNGAACSSHSVEPSHVLRAMKQNESKLYSSIRISLSRFTTKSEIEIVIKRLKQVILELRLMNNASI